MYTKFIKTIENNSQMKTYKKNDVIFYEEELCKFVCFVKKGSVKIASYSLNGKEIIFNIVNKDEMFGQTLIFSSSKKYKGNVIATENSELLFISKEKLIQLFSDEEFLKEYLQKLSDEVLKAKQQSRLLSFLNTSDRLLYYLSIHGEIKIKSITSLANLLCVSRESLSKTLKSLVLKQIISKQGKYIKLLK